MTNLAYEVIGENTRKTPLLCIHTVPLDSNYFMESLEGIDLDFQIILIDLPGHGKSEDLDTDEDFNFLTFANQIDKIREELDLEKISLLGHGVGGFVAQQYAISFNDFLESLILVNTSPNAKYRETMAWNIRENYSKVTIQALEEYKGKTDDKSIRVRFTQSLATYFHPNDHEKAKQLMDSAHRIGTDAYVHISHFLIPKIDYRERLRDVEQPVLVIACSNDVWPAAASQLLRNDMVHAKYTEFDTGHFPMVVKPKKFWNRIEKFILEKN